MKKKNARFFSLLLACAICLLLAPVAYADDTMKMYTKVELYTGDTLSLGSVYLKDSSAGDISDTFYCSSVFPPHLNAELDVTGGLLSPAWNAPDASVTNPNGYPVTVLKRGGSGFDGCNAGHICKQTDGTWLYSCTAGAGKSPYLWSYYIYTVTVVKVPVADISAATVSVSTSASYVPASAAYTVKTSDLDVTLTHNGKTYTINDFAFTDANIDPTAGIPDNQVTISLSGVAFTHEMPSAPKTNTNTNPLGVALPGTGSPTTADTDTADTAASGTGGNKTTSGGTDAAGAGDVVDDNPETGDSSAAAVSLALAIAVAAAAAYIALVPAKRRDI